MRSKLITSSLLAAAVGCTFVMAGHHTAQADLWEQFAFPGWMGECVTREHQDSRSTDVCSTHESKEVFEGGSYQEECNEDECDGHEIREMLSGEQASEWPAEEANHWVDVMLLHWCHHGWSVQEKHFHDDWMRHMCFPPTP